MNFEPLCGKDRAVQRLCDMNLLLSSVMGPSQKKAKTHSGIRDEDQFLNFLRMQDEPLSEGGWGMGLYDGVGRGLASVQDRPTYPDRVKAYPEDGSSQEALSRGSLYVEAGLAPHVGELLFTLGLGAAEVKEVMEKSVNERGELAVEGLALGLGRHLADAPSAEGLVGLLAERGISVKLRNEAPSSSTSQGESSRLKEQIAAFLRENGVPREKATALVEGLRLGQSDGASKAWQDQVRGKIGVEEKATGAMGRLEGNGVGGPFPKAGLVVEARHAPQVGELLFTMGLGAAEVKEVMERAAGEKGELLLERVSQGLGKYLPGAPSAQGLISLLTEKDISVKLRLESPAPHEEFSRLKEQIAGLLRENGIPPEKVRSFMETLSLSGQRPLQREQGDSAPGKAGARTRSLPEGSLMQFADEGSLSGLREKTQGILKGKASLNGNAERDTWYQQEGSGSTKKNGELQRQSELKGNQVSNQVVSSPDKNRAQGFEGITRAEPMEGARQDPKDPLILRETLKEGIMPPRIDRESQAGPHALPKNETSIPSPLPKVMERVLWMIQAGEQKGKVSLSPPELGRLDLDLVIKQGHLQANLSAENPAVKELIEANLDQLKQQLTDLGFHVDRFDVMLGLNDRPASHDPMWGEREGRGQSFRGSQAKTGDLKDESESSRGSGMALHQIDLMV